MKIVKQLATKVKSAVSEVSTFIPTQLSFWYGGQYVTNQTMNVFSQDLYEKLALLTTNVNNFPAVIFSDGGMSKFTIGADYQSINLPSLSCVFQLQTNQGNNLPYKPYVIGYRENHTFAINLNGITYIYALIEVANIDPNPTNAVTTLSYINSDTPLTDPRYCLICIVKPRGSGYSKIIDFTQTNFLVNSAVTTTNNTELLNPQNKINAITPQALSLFSNLGHVDAFDQRVIDSGGYAKDRVIREYDTTGYWVYYQSLIDNNTNIKPTLASHVGWIIVDAYTNTGQKVIFGNTIYPKVIYDQNQYSFYDGNGVSGSNLLAYYSSDGSLSPYYVGGFFQDRHMPQFMFNFSGINSNLNVINKVYLANGLVMLFGYFDGNDQRHVDYSGYGFNAAFPPIIAGSTTGGSGDIGCQILNIQVNPDYTQGFTVINCNVGGGHFSFTWFVIGRLANYVGDILAKIRAYKSSFYYEDLPENKKLELRQYYIALDETKDLTKVIAPEWLKAELEGKELA